MDEREKNLPKWAQYEFNVLRNKLGELEAALTVARYAAPLQGATGKVIADCMGGKGFPLSDRAYIEFHLPHGKIGVMLRDNGSLLDLNASGTLLILPRASNCAYAKVSD